MFSLFIAMRDFIKYDRMTLFLSANRISWGLLTWVLFLPASHLFAQGTDLRVEPPNWWVGMTNDTVQVLLHQKDIAQYTIQLEPYDGVSLTRVHTVASKNYVFLDLIIRDDTEPGVIHLVLTGAGKNPVRLDYPLWERESRDKEAPISQADVMYLITPDRFANGNPDNDRAKGMLEQPDRTNPHGRHGGDIAGIVNQLDYLDSLGVTALWINPLVENNMPTFSYHGYAITDFYRIDPRFGTLEEYLNLCEEARARGIKMVMDMVLNHCGSNHWWMKEPPDEQWINRWKQPYQETNHRKTTQTDPYASAEDLEEMVTGWFVKAMPDLNTTHPLLSKYLIYNTLWWIERCHLAGIRMDTYPYPDKTFMASWAKRVDEEYPGFFTVGEVWHYNAAITSYWQDRDDNRDGYRSYLPSVFDFPVQGALLAAMLEPEGPESGLYRLYEAASLDFMYPDPASLVTFPDNHDMSRLATVLQSDPAAIRNALAFLLTFRGIPCLYYGTEIMMQHPGSNDHGDIRADFPGGWAGDTVDGFVALGLSPEASAMQVWLRRILNFRKTSLALTAGKTTHFSPQKGVYVLFRHYNDEYIMVVIRKGSSPSELDLNRFSSILKGHRQGRDIFSGHIHPLDKPIELPGREPLILVIE